MHRPTPRSKRASIRSRIHPSIVPSSCFFRLTCFIALDDCDEENGCLRHVPGSHRWPLLPVTGLAGDMDAIQSVLSPQQQAEFRPVPTRLERGEASFHHPLTVHGSRENSSDRPLLEGVPVIPDQQPMGGQFFPLLYQPQEG